MVRQGTYTKRPSTLIRVKRKMGRKIKWFRKLSLKKKALIVSVPIVAFLVVTPFVTYAYYAKDIADKERLMNRNSTGIVLTDKDGVAFYTTGKAGRRESVAIDAISKQTIQALVASEDKDFYKHDGFSITGIVRAFYGNLLSRNITGGGSTITQQLVKNTLLTERQTFMRKYQELAIAVAVESKYSKDQILEMYLNSIFFGGSTFGIGDAAEFYFATQPAQLDLAQSAMLIGILPAPNAYSPTLGNLTYAKERQRTVLDRMVKNGFITEAEADAAYNEALVYAEPKRDETSVAPHFVQMVLDELYKKYDQETVIRSGYRVQTTLDSALQQTLQQNISDHIAFINANGGSNAAGVAIDPKSGSVRALVGSADWNNPEWGKVNIVTTARQPGSSFKPIYYSQALDSGLITPATILHDVQTDFGGYQPQNADRRFRGDVTVRSALNQSLNIPSIEVLQQFGIQTAIDGAKKLGITTIDDKKEYGLPLALGSAEVPLIQMTNAYAAFANEGQLYTPVTIESIDDKFNDSVYRAPKAVTTPAISPEGAYLISNILSDNAARAPIFGSSLTVPGRTAAVKTGTTDEQRDAWTIGYTPQLAIGVWVGNNDNAPMRNGGSGMAGPIWVNTMAKALTGTPNTAFTIPAGIVQRAVCFGQDALASRSGYGTFNEYFRSDGLPKKTCTPIDEPKKEEEKPPETTKPEDDKTEVTTPPPATSGGTGSGSGAPSNPQNPSPIQQPSGNMNLMRSL